MKYLISEENVVEEIVSGLKSTLSWDIGLFVHLATLGYVLGFLCKNQLALRMLVLMATVSYMIYYYAFPLEPLWGAIFGSVLIMIANIIGTIRLLFDQFPIKIKPEYLPIYERLTGVKPGEFRRLIKSAEVVTPAIDMTLTTENIPPDHLFYLMHGTATASKLDDEFSIPSGRFVGEVGFILGGAASATVVIPEGSMVMRWEHQRLSKLLKKNPNLHRAFEAMIGRDMASKVASSRPIFAKEPLVVEQGLLSG